jgi:hypothetical protein
MEIFFQMSLRVLRLSRILQFLMLVLHVSTYQIALQYTRTHLPDTIFSSTFFYISFPHSGHTGEEVIMM